MARFENRFFKVLTEQDNEREAMEATLDADTDAGEFDVDVEVDETVVEDDPNVKAAIAVEERNEAMRITLQGWISQL